MDTVKILSNVLNWSSFLEVRKRLYGLVIPEHRKEIELDLSDISRVFPNGIVPLVATIDLYRRAHKIALHVVPPVQDNIRNLCLRQGFLHFLDEERFPEGVSSPTALSLQSFDSDDQLNVLINRIMEVCLQQLSFGAGIEPAFHWAINEISGNVLVHAQAKGWLLVQTYSDNHKLVLTICDAGIGVPATMKKGFPTIGNDEEALRSAIKPGVTSNPKHGQGNGLAGCISIAQASSGYFMLASGSSQLKVEKGNVYAERNIPPIQGTCVDMQLPTDVSIDLPKTLFGHEPVSFSEMKYENIVGDLEIKLTDYATNFGNRLTGEKIRNLIRNLLVQNPGKRIVIEMGDVSLIASSFADELFGKLAFDLGIIDFASIIQLKNLNPLCKSLINTAIQQRFKQGTSS